MTQEELLKKRFQELADKSYQGNQYTFTNFLSMGEQASYFQMEQSLSYAGGVLFGGMEEAERRVLRFGKPEELGYEEEFPITCLTVAPLMEKFADTLTHRDFLGALMNLGIERELLGDIIVRGHTAYIFCLQRIAGYLTENLVQVKHTRIRVTETETLPESARPELKEEAMSVSSLRLDVVVAGVYRLSRSDSLLLFKEKKVFANGRQCENNSYLCKDGDRISVRGYGRFLFTGVNGTTGKGRLHIRIQRYV